MHIVISFLFLILIYSILSHKVQTKTIDFKWINDNIYFAKYINSVLYKLDRDNEKINKIFIFFILVFLFISCYFSAYSWYIFINNFSVLAYTHVKI